MFNPDKFQWRIFNPQEGVPEYVCNWLLDGQSLTAKLRDKYKDFKVNVMSQEQDNPYDCELKLLEATSNQTFIVREVELIGSQVPVVIARSLIPLTQDTNEILKIGAKPLGEILFNDPEIKRGHLEVGSFNESWARRSTFKIGKTKLLVSEIFLESLYA
ncbi:chorismate lyase [Hyphomicrobiales bacterium]|jgi:chorismate lyase|nr:chorismate lyase [Rhodobiaceae bacterium]MBT5640435.1 chorismate lyase [Rhodobiaceae bacterium]MBT6222576.1 chorismate lyase [Rhodobiaceae bacterium]MDC0139393.1 chorismate lyase [Hyphomicrobiales bacterium]